MATIHPAILGVYFKHIAYFITHPDRLSLLGIPNPKNRYVKSNKSP
jgi:hypothetical protein